MGAPSSFAPSVSIRRAAHKPGHHCGGHSIRCAERVRADQDATFRDVETLARLEDLPVNHFCHRERELRVRHDLKVIADCRDPHIGRRGKYSVATLSMASLMKQKRE
jgi:hypothetical protein